MRSARHDGQLSPGHELGDLLRLQRGHEEVALGPDDVERHRQRAQPVAGVVSRAGVELADERVARLRVRVGQQHVAEVLHRLLVLVELLRDRLQQSQSRCSSSLRCAAARLHRRAKSRAQRPPQAKVTTRVSVRTRSGAASATSWAMVPPMRHPEQVEAVEPEPVDQGERVLGHVGDPVRTLGAEGLPGVAVVQHDGLEASGSRPGPAASTPSGPRTGRSRTAAARLRPGPRSTAGGRRSRTRAWRGRLAESAAQPGKPGGHRAAPVHRQPRRRAAPAAVTTAALTTARA